MTCFFLYNQGLSHTSSIAQTPVFERVSRHYYSKEHYIHDVGTEELEHLEMVGTIVHQLTRDLSEKEIKEQGFAPYYVDHGKEFFPASAAGVPWTGAYIQSMDDVIADLTEDLAAEQKARGTYDNILRQREVVHLQRFGEALRRVTDFKGSKKYY